MALNLRLCLPRRVVLYVYDVNDKSLDIFLDRVKAFCGAGDEEDADAGPAGYCVVVVGDEAIPG